MFVKHVQRPYEQSLSPPERESERIKKEEKEEGRDGAKERKEGTEKNKKKETEVIRKWLNVFKLPLHLNMRFDI